MKSLISKKSTLSLLITTLTLASTLSACSTTTDTTTDKPASSAAPAATKPAGNAAEQSPEGKYDPPISVSMVRDMPGGLTFPQGDSLDSNVMTKLLEQTYGVKIENKWVTDGVTYNDKLNVAIASGDLPDIFRVQPIQLKQLADAGIIADLTDVYKKNITPLADEKLRTDKGVGLASATLDGKLMGIPYVNAAIEGAQMLWVRKDWLDNLGLTEPKTMDDVYKISKAFKNNDPDKNGKSDTFGLGFYSNIFGGFGGMTGFFNGFHAYKNMWVKDPKGGNELVQGNLQPEMKQALAKLQELYKSGEIDKEFSVKTADQLLQDIVAGKIGMFYGAFSEPLNKLNKAVTADAKQVWEMYPLPSVDAKPALAQVTAMPAYYWVVNKKSKNPAAAIKMMNLYVEKIFGKTADFKFMYDGNFAVYQYQDVKTFGATKNLDHFLAIKAGLAGDMSKLNPEGKGYFDQVKQYQSGDKTMWRYAKIFGPDGSEKVINKYVTENQLYYDQFTGIPSELMVEKTGTLGDVTNETFMKILLGESPDLFDKFVANYNKLGGTDITKQVNDWYGKQKK
ncbi:extracellular solute-binding protein [Paenibacillus qinlingensis]|uniref:Aldouronate transport system substrate-binding protein n=1 Tax=Paenibacillus qinlingensis TaxID=1837343 RepID=A0ABU1NYD5_9BACL|nr:extracellular solute-binding protein [Paenibacillus qinlingensis]MDR6552017.1 putative aldouronate transport system substrate-binding protein [Paenibacillus qinlingensis]